MTRPDCYLTDSLPQGFETDFRAWVKAAVASERKFREAASTTEDGQTTKFYIHARL